MQELETGKKELILLNPSLIVQLIEFFGFRPKARFINNDLTHFFKVQSVLSSPIASPSSTYAPIPGIVASLAADAGASFLCVRPSTRSFSCWVCVVWFSSASAAATFANAAAAAFDLPFCAVRRANTWLSVSVPCFVSFWSCPEKSLPCLWTSFRLD